MQNPALLYALLLSGVAIGWWLGFRFAHQSKKKNYPDFIPSVEYLLAATNDRTLARLLEGQQLDDDAIDLFLKLGRTLRVKGETERAIHLHQSLFARTDLPRATLLTLKLELALDYFDAGLLDRAEKLLLELIEHKTKDTPFEQSAMRLVQLYEEEGEWQKISELYQERRLPKSEALEKRISHAYCELAERALKQRNFLDARQLCRQALKIHGQCGRAYVVQGNLAYSQDEPNEAIRCYLRALDLNSKAALTVLTPLMDSLTKVNDDKGLMHNSYRLWQQTRFEPALKLYIFSVAAEQGPEKAIPMLLEELAHSPSNQGFAIMVELVVHYQLQLDKHHLQKLYGILRAVVAHEPKYVCENCGFKANEFHWLCPSCRNWSSISNFVPKQAQSKLELE